jgi:hypothetical protein
MRRQTPAPFLATVWNLDELDGSTVAFAFVAVIGRETAEDELFGRRDVSW